MALRKEALHFLHVGQIGGDREDAESLTLPDVFSSDGSRNVYMDKDGRATSILGYAKINPVAVVSNTGAEAVRLRALFQYGARFISGQLSRLLLGVFEGATTYEIRSSLNGGGTWSLVAELGSAYVGQIPDFAQSGNQLVITFGTGPVKSFDGGIGNASSAQLAAPVPTASLNVGLLDGTYQWKVVPIKADGTRKAASVASASVSINKKQVTVAWATDTEAVTYEVYRTTGTGKVYFYETALPSGTLTFTSNTADLQLIAGRALQEYGDAPPNAAWFAELHTERIFYGRTNNYPRRVWYSDPGLPYSVNADANFFDFTDGESYTDIYVGGTGNFRGMFVAWLERSVWTISGKGRYSGVVIDYERRRTDAQTGTVSHRTVARVPAGSVFIDAQGRQQQTTDVMLAYLTPLGDVRLFDGSNDVIISWPKKDVFKRLSYASRAKAFALLDVEHSEVTWVFPIDNSVENNYAVTWNLRNGQMVERQWTFAHAITIDADDDAVKVVAGESSRTVGGFCYEVWKAGVYTLDGTAINARVTTKTLYGRDRNGQNLMHQDKRWHWIELLIKDIDLSNTFTVEWWPTESDLAEAVVNSRSGLQLAESPIYTADDSQLLTNDDSPLTAGVGHGIIRVNLKDVRASGIVRHLTSRGLRLRVTNTGSGQAAVVGFTVAYQLLNDIKQRYRR